MKNEGVLEQLERGKFGFDWNLPAPPLGGVGPMVVVVVVVFRVCLWFLFVFVWDARNEKDRKEAKCPRWFGLWGTVIVPTYLVRYRMVLYCM